MRHSYFSYSVTSNVPKSTLIEGIGVSNYLDVVCGVLDS